MCVFCLITSGHTLKEKSDEKNKTETSHKTIYEKRGSMGGEFAIDTMDVAFKNMFSLSLKKDKSVIQSFLNCFFFDFNTDQVGDIEELPALKKRGRKANLYGRACGNTIWAVLHY